MTDRNCSGVSRVAGTEVPMPALLTKMSTLPKARTVASTSSTTVVWTRHVGPHRDGPSACVLDKFAGAYQAVLSTRAE